MKAWKCSRCSQVEINELQGYSCLSVLTLNQLSSSFKFLFNASIISGPEGYCYCGYYNYFILRYPSSTSLPFLSSGQRFQKYWGLNYHDRLSLNHHPLPDLLFATSVICIPMNVVQGLTVNIFKLMIDLHWIAHATSAVYSVILLVKLNFSTYFFTC